MDKLVQMLNDALMAENQASYQYMNHYNNVRGKYPDIVDHFKDHMDDEIGHATRLADRIYVLGGTPETNMKDVAEYTEDVDEALKQDIIAEQQAIDLYSEIIQYCEEVGDRATQVLIEDILTDEVSHLDEFARLRRSTVRR